MDVAMATCRGQSALTNRQPSITIVLIALIVEYGAKLKFVARFWLAETGSEAGVLVRGGGGMRLL